MFDLLKNYTPKGLQNFMFRLLKPFINYYYNSGNKVECVICDSKFKAFRSHGYVFRKNARCTNCNSLERHRLLWKYIHKKTALLASKTKIKVLHFAPEKFFYQLFDQYEHIQYFPCDINPDQYPYIGKANINKVDVTSIPFDDNTFDFILCSHVLEHIIDDSKAMKELYRVMKKAGFGIFQVPLDYKREFTYEDASITLPKDREKAFEQYDHVRIYGRDYKSRLENAGFTVVEDDFVKHFTNHERYKYGFDANELLFKCIKD